MSESESLYIERENCGNCYRCVRECEVKAITLHGAAATIDSARCVGCGACLAMCDQRSVRLRDDVHLARKFIKNYNTKVASVAPTWMAEFEGIDSGRFIEALKLLGFSHVSESALGAQATLAEETRQLKERRGVGISTRCPAATDYIRKYKPRLAPMLLDVETPMLTHARMIRNWWGHDARVIHISSCAASKAEADKNPGLIEISLTFRELKEWMRNEGINLDRIPGGAGYQFEPFTAKKATGYQLTGWGAQREFRAEFEKHGMIGMTASSMGALAGSLATAPSPGDMAVYLDLMACPGGCIGSKAFSITKASPVDLRLAFETTAIKRMQTGESYKLPHVPFGRSDAAPEPVNEFVGEGDTLRALQSLGIINEAEQINCNGCGYGTCRRFAKALSRNRVRRDMCTHFVQSELRAKFTTLLAKLSSGVAVVSGSGRIVEANRLFATMMGTKAEMLYDSTPGLAGIKYSEVAPIEALVESVLRDEQESTVRDVQIRERIITVSVHSIQRYKMAMVICRNMIFSQVRNDEIVSRTQKVIRDNLETVQKIAHLLGENASRTEAILNSILDSHSKEDER